MTPTTAPSDHVQTSAHDASDEPLDTTLEADGDAGFSTAELLGNAALGIAALAVIWTGLQQLGIDVLAQMRGALGL